MPNVQRPTPKTLAAVITPATRTGRAPVNQWRDELRLVPQLWDAKDVFLSEEEWDTTENVPPSKNATAVTATRKWRLPPREFHDAVLGGLGWK